MSRHVNDLSLSELIYHRTEYRKEWVHSRQSKQIDASKAIYQWYARISVLRSRICNVQESAYISKEQQSEIIGRLKTKIMKLELKIFAHREMMVNMLAHCTEDKDEGMKMWNDLIEKKTPKLSA